MASEQTGSQAALDEALAACASEPIRTPGGIQSFGTLLAVGPAGDVTHCGANVAEYVGVGPDEVLGRQLAAVFPEWKIVPDDQPEGVLLNAGTVGLPAAGPVEVYAHRHAGVRFVELVPAAAEGALPVRTVTALGDLTRQLDDHPRAFARRLARLARSLTGYDRVMVYQFDPFWNGEVIAEDRADGLESFTGLWYPAADIPPQARDLYLRVRTRVLADALARPVPVVGRTRVPGRELDLSHALLRAVSPVHREYLTNMGVRGTAVASVVVRGGLWGLIACHNVGPRTPAPAAVQLLDVLARVLGSQIALAEQSERVRGKGLGQELLSSLAHVLAPGADIAAGLVDPQLGLMELMTADGLAVSVEDRVTARGHVPPAAFVLRLVDWLEERGDWLFSTDRLGETEPALAGERRAAGVLALRVPNTARGWVLWVRGELAHSIRWAGNPRKGLVTEGGRHRLTPRGSFEAWRAEVLGRSAGWTTAELALAEDVIRPNLYEILEAVARRTAEAAHRESESRLRAIFDAQFQFIGLLSVDGTVLEMNRTALALIDRSEAAVVGRPFWETEWWTHDGGLRDRVRGAVRRAAGGDRSRFETNHPTPGGGQVWIDFSMTPYRDAAGRIVFLIPEGRDITERKRAAEQIQRTRELLLDAIESLDSGFVMYDADERLVVCNTRYKELYAACAHAMVPGAKYADILRAFCDRGGHAASGLTADEWTADRLRTHRTAGEPTEQRVGDRRIRISDRRTRDGGVVSLRTDITALKEAQEQAEAASKAKGEFLANMSHEIRTPMNGILGMTALILESELTAEQRDSLNVVASSADALLTVINDILDFSKIEAGKLDLDPAPFALRDLLGDTLKAFALKAHAKGLELACDVHPDVPDGLIGDAGRLRQVLTNLVGNAIKFTRTGEVVVTARVCPVPSGVRVHFSIRDTGIGIPRAKQASIFEAFTQADGSTTRQYGGTGLGLAISTRLVQLMGGSIRVESEPGRGSDFQFEARFDLARRSFADAVVRPPQQLTGARVLVVDDNATNRRVLAETLQMWGANPTCAASGPAALIELRRAADPYHLILLDVMMPGMDGFAVAEQIVRDPLLTGPVVMMLTSADARGDAARCRTLGVSAYLVKPVKAAELLKAITAALGDDGPAPRRPAAPTAARPPGYGPPRRTLEVLLAEDNVVNQLVAVRLMKKLGHNVTVANHGGEALAATKQQRFHLILMDVQMPEMDGFEATRRIRADELGHGRRTPIVAMTAHAMAGDRERCLAGGMDDYLTKPIDRDELFRVLHWAECLDPAAAPGGRGGAAPPSFDRATALERLGGDEDLFAEVAGVFRTDGPKLLGEIRAAIASGDAATVLRSAHGLKGAAGYVGGTLAASAAQRLERLGAEGNLAAAPEALRALETEVNRLVADLA
jgi:PAS domain S-box-containing protein